MSGFDERRVNSIPAQEYDLAESEVGRLLVEIQFAYRCRQRIEQLKSDLTSPLSQLEKAETEFEDFKAGMEELASEIENLRNGREQYRRKEPRKFTELTNQIVAKEQEERDRQRRLGIMAENIRDQRDKIKNRKMEISLLDNHTRPPSPDQFPAIVQWLQQAVLNGHS